MSERFFGECGRLVVKVLGVRTCGALRTPGGPQKGLIGNSRFNRKTQEKLRKTKKSNERQGQTKNMWELKLTG